MNEAAEREVKFTVSRADALALIASSVVLTAGEKVITYYDDAQERLLARRATFRRVMKKGALVDELKTVTSWDDKGRDAMELTSPIIVSGIPDTLADRDIECELAARVASELQSNGTFTLQRRESLRVLRSALRRPELKRAIEVDQCWCDAGDFCEVEYEAADDADERAAVELVMRECKSAKRSVMTKRERARYGATGTRC